MFGRIPPLLHVYDFHVQHSPKLHLDPAEVMHGSCDGGSRRGYLPYEGWRNHEISSLVSFSDSADSGGGDSRSADATVINLIGNFDRWVPFESALLALGGKKTHGRTVAGQWRESVALKMFKKLTGVPFVSAAVPAERSSRVPGGYRGGGE